MSVIVITAGLFDVVKKSGHVDLKLWTHRARFALENFWTNAGNFAVLVCCSNKLVHLGSKNLAPCTRNLMQKLNELSLLASKSNMNGPKDC